jgi:two-component system, NtrC family, sensor histidine kinase HydH
MAMTGSALPDVVPPTARPAGPADGRTGDRVDTGRVPFSLRRRFALASLVVITVIAIGLGWMLSRVLTERMLQREAEVTMHFVQNVLVTDGTSTYFRRPDDPAQREAFLQSMRHIVTMRESVRANAYDRRGHVLWSTDDSLIGQAFDHNAELAEALQGRMVVEADEAEPGQFAKAEHQGLVHRGAFFVETYFPVRDPQDGAVVGVIEIYKVPEQLTSDIHQGLRQLWLACFGGAVLLFAVLYWIVARADRLITEQQRRLAEAQRTASTVELASAVAHSLRNPLASIRSAAELLQDHAQRPEDVRELSGDVVEAVDRANRWITELVHVAQAPQLHPQALDLVALVQTCLQEIAGELGRRGIRLRVDPTGPLPVLAHSATLRQALLSIIANAAEAMPGGGRLEVTWTRSEGLMGVCLSDDGTGLSPEAQKRLFQPFASSKVGGLGMGLALVKRMVEQWQGELRVTPEHPRGTRVEIRLPYPSGPGAGH